MYCCLLLLLLVAQVQFDPREVLVRQGDVSDCMYVLKSGQVCVLIDPSMTLSAASSDINSSSTVGSISGTIWSSSGLTAPDGSGELDTKKMIQVSCWCQPGRGGGGHQLPGDCPITTRYGFHR
jgi:hypothetical protein